jgi:uncharacterized membrane protein YedE/YeeE
MAKRAAVAVAAPPASAARAAAAPSAAEFTPVESTLGGLMVGASAASLLLTHGRIAGISGVCSGLLHGAVGADFTWRALFLGGLLGGNALHLALHRREPLPAMPQLSAARFAVAGALVGAGTRLGSGCTSGHGICGLARGSPRSIAAVGTFMLAGAATSFVLSRRERRATGAPRPAFSLAPRRKRSHRFALVALGACSAALVLSARLAAKRTNLLLTGVTFGLGLAVSGMTQPEKVMRFLDVTGQNGPWDPSLAFVMGGGLLASAVSYQVKGRCAAPLLAARYLMPVKCVVHALCTQHLRVLPHPRADVRAPGRSWTRAWWRAPRSSGSDGQLPEHAQGPQLPTSRCRSSAAASAPAWRPSWPPWRSAWRW